MVQKSREVESIEIASKIAFDSALKNATTSDEDCSYCHKIWTEHNMHSFRDFLVWYSNLDVKPFLKAIEKQSNVYGQKGTDMLESVIFLPRLAIRCLFEDDTKYVAHATSQKYKKKTSPGLFRLIR